MSTLEYRPTQADDAPALARLGRDSFVAAFGHLYDRADLDAFLEQVYSVEAVAAEIANPVMLHRLAADGVHLAGFAKLILLDYYAGHSDAIRPIVLGQLYTAPDLTGQGIGAALMEWTFEQARARGCDAIQLSVWSGNDGAQRFYARHGFRKIADIDFWVGNHRDDEYLYELRLT